MAKKKTVSKPKAKAKSERDEIAILVSSGLAHLSAQGNQVNFDKVAVNAYGIADALLARREKD